MSSSVQSSCAIFSFVFLVCFREKQKKRKEKDEKGEIQCGWRRREQDGKRRDCRKEGAKEEKRNEKKVKERRAGGKTSSSLPFFALRFLDREKLEKLKRGEKGMVIVCRKKVDFHGNTIFPREKEENPLSVGLLFDITLSFSPCSLPLLLFISSSFTLNESESLQPAI